MSIFVSFVSHLWPENPFRQIHMKLVKEFRSSSGTQRPPFLHVSIRRQIELRKHRDPVFVNGQRQIDRLFAKPTQIESDEQLHSCRIVGIVPDRSELHRQESISTYLDDPRYLRLHDMRQSCCAGMVSWALIRLTGMKRNFTGSIQLVR